MSTEVDQRVVEMKFDNKNFEKNVSTSMDTLKRFKDALSFKGATEGIEKLNKEAKSFSLEPLVDAAQTVELKFSTMSIAAISAINRIVSSATDAGIRLVKSLSVDNIAAGWQKFSDKTVSVGTLVAQGYDMSTVEAQLKRLNWFTDETSYNFVDMVENIAKFTATGKDLEQSVTALEGIANWAALSGQNAATASHAMFQLSQAMGAGIMRKEDWKSIQNVSMDTDEFRQKALDAGVAVGTLKKNLDGMYQSLVTNTKKFDKAQFAEHLTQDAWFTDKVMMKVFQDYSAAVDKIYGYATIKGITASEAMEELGDQLDEFALKAFKSAQEARTWADVVGSVKDAVSTGWMNTFELIFGNYDEATKLFTDLANGLYDVFAEGGNNRNEVLAEGLMTGWKQLLNEGIPDAEKFKDIIFEIGKATGQLDDDAIAKIREDFEGSLKDGWLTADLLDASLFKVTSDFRVLSKEQLIEKGYTEAQIAALQVLNENFLSGAISAEEYADQMSRMSGRENLVEAFWNIYNALFAIDEETGEAIGLISSFKEAVADIFPPITGDVIYNIAERIKEFSERLIPSRETIEKFKSVVRGLASAVDILGQVFNAVWRSLKPVFDLLKIGADKAFDFSASLGDIITNFAKTAKETDFFYNKLQSFIGVIKEAVQKVKDFIVTMLEFVGIKSKDSSDLFSGVTGALEKANGIFGAFRKGAEKVIEVIQNVKTKITEGVGSITIDLSKPVAILETLWNIVSSLFNGLLTVIGNILGLVQDLFSSLNPTNFRDLISLIISGLATINIKWLADSITSVTDVLWTLQNNIKADSLMKIAKAVAILTAAIVVLSLIDTDKLYSAIGAIALLMTELSTMLKSMTNMLNTQASSFKVAILSFMNVMKLKELTIALKTMATGILIAAVALYLIGKMDWEEIARGLIGLAGVMVILITFLKYLAKIEGSTRDAIKIIKSLIPLGLAMILFSAAMRNMAKMTWDELIRALVGFFGVIEIVLILCKYLQKMEGSTKDSVKIIKAMIPFALAMILVSAAMRNMAKMTWDEIIRSLAGFAGVITILIILCQQLQNMQSGVDNGTAIIKKLIPFALAMLLISAAMRNMAKMTWDELVRSLVGFGGVIAILIILCQELQTMSAGVDNGTAIIKKLIPMALAMILVSAAMRNMAKLSWDEMLLGVVAFGLLMAEIVAALAILNNLGGEGGAGKLAGVGAAILLVSTSMLILAAALKVVSKIPVLSLVASILGLSVALAAIVDLAYMAEPVIGPMLALAGAFALIGIGSLAAGAGLLMVTAAITALVAIGPAAIQLIYDALVSIVTLIPNLATALAVGIVSFMDTMINAGPTILSFLETMADLVLQVVINVLPKLGEIVVRALDVLINILEESGPKILRILELLLDMALTALIDFVPKILDAALELVLRLADVLVENAPKLAVAGVAIIMALLDGIAQAQVYMVQKGFEIAINFLNGMADTIRENKPLLKEAFFNLVDAVVGDIGEKWEDFKDAAKNLIDGFIEGITTKVNDAVEAIKTFGSTIVENFKSIFKIESPSKVMRDEVGRFIVEGIAEGITENMSAEEAAKKKAENIVNIFKESIEKINTEISGLQIEFELWDVTNVHKTKKERLDKQLEMLAKQLGSAEKKLEYEEAKFKTIALEFAEDSDTYIEASNNLSTARTEFVKVRNSYYEALAQVQIPEIALNDAGSLIIKGLAYGISSDMTAEEVAAQKAQNIVAAFEKVYDKLDVSETIRDLQSDIWELSNPDAKKKDVMIHSILKLREDIKTQAERVNYAEAEWKATIQKYGEDSEEATAAYQRYLQALRDGIELEASLEALRKDNKSLFNSAMAQIDTMTDDEVASYLGIPNDNAIVSAFEKIRDEVGRISETIFDGDGPFSDISNSEALQKLLDGIDVEIKPEVIEGILGDWVGIAGEEGQKASSEAISAFVSNFDATRISEINRLLRTPGEEFSKKAREMLDLARFELSSALMSGMIDDEAYKSLSKSLDSLESRLIARARDLGELIPISLDMGINNSGATNDLKTGVIDMVQDYILDAAASHEGLDINSPSKKGIKLGESFVVGICDGLLNMANNLKKASLDVINEAIVPAEGIVARIEDVLAGDLDVQPVITPIIDISDVQSKTGLINDMLSAQNTYRMAADTLEIQSKNAKMSQYDKTAQVDELTRRLDSLVYGLDDLRDVLYAQNDRDLNVEVNVDGAKLANATIDNFLSASRANGTPFYTNH